LASLMRLSLLKAAHVAVGQCRVQEIRVAHLVQPMYAKVREHGAPVQGARLVTNGEIGRTKPHMYRGTLVHMMGPVEVDRIQTGVRMEKRLLKVLKAVAELKDMTLGDLLEGIVLHAFEGKSAFSPQTLKEIEQFKSIYGLTLHASDSHRLRERK
jgi:hypothetical protein